jgi:hypothetical protein
LRRDAEGVGHAIEEGEERDNVHRLCNLIFRPAGRAQFQNVGGRRFVSGLRDERGVIEQGALGGRQAGFVEFAFQNGCDAWIAGSLSTQEVSVAVQSIRAAVQKRNVARDHLLVTAREMPLGKVNGVRELDDLSQKIGPRSEALDDPRKLPAPGSGSPEIIGGGSFPGGFVVFGDANFCVHAKRSVVMSKTRGVGAFIQQLPGQRSTDLGVRSGVRCIGFWGPPAACANAAEDVFWGRL